MLWAVGSPEPGPTQRQVALAGATGDSGVARAGLTSGSAAVRSSALSALARCGRLGPRELEAGLSDPVPRVRARACVLASLALPEQAEELLAHALGDKDQSVVEAAAFALGERGQAGAGTIEVLAGVALGHPGALCREAAVAALGAIGAPEGLPTVLAALADKPAIRRRAVVALAAYEGAEAAQALLDATADPDWQVRQAAEDLLGRPG